MARETAHLTANSKRECHNVCRLTVVTGKDIPDTFRDECSGLSLSIGSMKRRSSRDAETDARNHDDCDSASDVEGSSVSVEQDGLMTDHGHVVSLPEAASFYRYLGRGHTRTHAL